MAGIEGLEPGPHLSASIYISLCDLPALLGPWGNPGQKYETLLSRQSLLQLELQVRGTAGTSGTISYSLRAEGCVSDGLNKPFLKN